MAKYDKEEMKKKKKEKMMTNKKKKLFVDRDGCMRHWSFDKLDASSVSSAVLADCVQYLVLVSEGRQIVSSLFIAPHHLKIFTKKLVLCLRR